VDFEFGIIVQSRRRSATTACSPFFGGSFLFLARRVQRAPSQFFASRQHLHFSKPTSLCMRVLLSHNFVPATLFGSMPNHLEGALGATAEVRDRADFLSKIIPEAEQKVNYKLLQPVIEGNVSLDMLYFLGC
jgi:hypothetical protein